MYKLHMCGTWVYCTVCTKQVLYTFDSHTISKILSSLKKIYSAHNSITTIIVDLIMCPYFIAEFRNRLISAVAGLATCNDSQSSRDMYAFQTLSKCVSVMYCKNGDENIFSHITWRISKINIFNQLSITRKCDEKNWNMQELRQSQ